MYAVQVAEKEDGMFGVELMLMLPSGPVELNEEVYTADVKITESISFTLNQGKEEEEGSKSSQEPSLPGPLPALPVKDVRDRTHTLVLWGGREGAGCSVTLHIHTDRFCSRNTGSARIFDEAKIILWAGFCSGHTHFSL